ncbi:hypothetical protein [Actinomadura atramentaria]|uniref:hypothetical protein n=1 Tax=Actinomadura atramentaria TaxID=1990 RepID=UPI00037D0E87|nr:hypothetical protein [Actinomadura atramentaria]
MRTQSCAAPVCGPGADERRCRSGTAPGLRVCAACRDRLRGALERLPALYDECGTALAHPSRSPRERVGGTRPLGLSLPEPVVAARAEILSVLASWAALVADERAVAPPPRAVRALAVFLVRHLDWLLAHPAAADLVGEVAAVSRAARRAAAPDRAARLALGRCGRQGCDATVTADVGDRGDRPPGEARCGAGHVWHAHQWLLLARRMERAGRVRGGAGS